MAEQKKRSVVIPTAEQLEAAAAEDAKALAGEGAPSETVSGETMPAPAPQPLPEGFDLDGLAFALAAATSMEQLAALKTDWLVYRDAAMAVDPEGSAHLDEAFAARETKIVELSAIPARGADVRRHFRVEKQCVPRIDGMQVQIGAGESVFWTPAEVDQAVRQGVPLLPIADPNDPIEQVALSTYNTARTVAMARGEGFMPPWHETTEIAREDARNAARKLIEAR